MQNNDRAEKKRVKFDGVEIVGLVNVSEITLEEQTVDVPSFNKIRPVRSGITQFPTVSLTYKINKGSNTLSFFQQFKNNKETKTMTIESTDAHGTVFEKRNYVDAECHSISDPAYDAASPTYAQRTVILTYDDVVQLPVD